VSVQLLTAPFPLRAVARGIRKVAFDISRVFLSDIALNATF